MFLAALSREQALGVPGVAATDSGPAGLFATVDQLRRVDGVRCVAAGQDVYEVSLRLCCQLVPLPQAARAVRSSVLSAASNAGISVSEVNVFIADLLEPEGV